MVYTNRIPRNICDRLCPAPPARVSSRSGEDGPGKQTARPPHFTARSTGAAGGEGLAQVPPPAQGEAGLHTQEAWHLSPALGRLCVSPANSPPPPPPRPPGSGDLRCPTDRVSRAPPATETDEEKPGHAPRWLLRSHGHRGFSTLFKKVQIRRLCVFFFFFPDLQFKKILWETIGSKRNIFQSPSNEQI